MPKLTRSGYDAFCERLTPMLKRVNKRIPADEHYAIEPFEDVFGEDGERDDWLRFSEDQLRVIVRSIAENTPSDQVAESFSDMVRRLKPRDRLGAHELAIMGELGMPARDRQILTR